MGESRITPSGIINDAVSMIGKMNDSSFPIDVFPNKTLIPQHYYKIFFLST